MRDITIRERIIALVSSMTVSVGILFASDIIAAIGFVIVDRALGLTVSKMDTSFQESVSLQFIVALFSAFIAFALAYWYLKQQKKTKNNIGITSFKVQYVAKSVGYLLVYFVCFFIVAVLLKKFIPAIDQNQEQEIGFDTASTLVHYLLMFVLIVIIIPLKEELLFRGLLFIRLREKLTFITSALVTSLVFGALHLEFIGKGPLNWMAAVDTFILSLFLSRLVDKTRSLWPAVLVHSLKNTVAFFILFGPQIRALL